MPRLELRSNRHFPTFSNLPPEHDLDLDFYDITGSVLRPSHHWVFLGEIIEDQSIFRTRYLIQDRNGDAVPIAFHHDNFDMIQYNVNPATFSLGQTIAVFYAENHPFMDGTYGIRVNSLATIKLIPCPLHALLSAKPQSVDEQTICTVCRKKEPNVSLQRCTKCKTKYCSQKCQNADWTTHKQVCTALSQIRLWNTRDWDTFADFWNAF